MKIKKDSLKEAFAIIKEANFGDLVGGNSILFFPFDIEEKVKEREGGIILVETAQEGSRSFVKSGFVVGYEDGPQIGYLSTEYAVKLDLETHFDLFSHQKQPLNKKKLDTLKQYDCFLVKDVQILALFKF